MKRENELHIHRAAQVSMRPRPAVAGLWCALVLALSAVMTAGANTINVKVLHEFTPLLSNGSNPQTALVRGSDGNFYGTATYGGTYGVGTVFKITPGGVFSILHEFTGFDGAEPGGALVEGSDGDFYGTTSAGGIDEGTIFKITPGGVFSVLQYFNGDNGDSPSAALILGHDGDFYGTTTFGGANGAGTVFKTTPGGHVTVLYSFATEDSDNFSNTDGSRPISSLLLAPDGYFYGTTSRGGPDGEGTVFRISSSGKLLTLHRFTTIGEDFSNYDGAEPLAGLILGKDGNFYGTASKSGPDRAGTVFKITPSGTFTTFHRFTSTDNTDASNQGGMPSAPLLLGRDGNFYGTCAAGGGANGNGVVFKLTPTGEYSIFHEFGTVDGNGYNGGGGGPVAGLIQDNTGEFYGTAYSGGALGFGTTFKLTPGGAYTLTHTFNYYNADGAGSSATLIKDSDGNYYGTTPNGGENNNGTVFRISSTGVLTTTHSFAATDVYENNADGTVPNDGLVLGKDGDLYGTTEFGGAHHAGVVFKITPGGTLTTLHSFFTLNSSGENAEGASPFASLVLGKDGNFYGTTTAGGTAGNGTVFKMTPAGSVGAIHSFSALSSGDSNENSDGAYPVAALTQGRDGDFYGTTNKGGTGAHGTVFKITPGGTLTTLHNFTFINQVESTSADGDSPESGLYADSDGDFYGTATLGGVNGTGTVFKITATGTFTTLHSFGAYDENYHNSDGAVPVGTLIKGIDGYLYGTTSQGGPSGSGTAYRMTSTGGVSLLAAFDATDANGFNEDGTFCLAGLTQDSLGNFFGTTQKGGTSGKGTIFEIGYSPVIISASTANAAVGEAFRYQIMATNTPTSFAASGLPKGLSLNTTTGLITGTPTNAGEDTATLAAYNRSGKGQGTLAFNIGAKGTPVISSPTTAYATQGVAFSYQIKASESPTMYAVSGLPSGLTLNAHTGLISGSPEDEGKIRLTLAAYNAAGKGTQVVPLTLAPFDSPVITSAGTASGKVGAAFAYQTVATQSPTSYSAQGLPEGLTISGTTGKISGKSTTAGTYAATLHATNSSGEGSANFTVTVAAE